MKKYKYLTILSFFMLTMMISNVLAVNTINFDDKIDKNQDLETLEVSYKDNWLKIDVKCSNLSIFFIDNIGIYINSDLSYIFNVRMLKEISISIKILYQNNTNIDIKAHLRSNSGFNANKKVLDKNIELKQESTDFISEIMENKDYFVLLIIFAIVITILCFLVIGIAIKYSRDLNNL